MDYFAQLPFNPCGFWIAVFLLDCMRALLSWKPGLVKCKLHSLLSFCSVYSSTVLY